MAVGDTLKGTRVPLAEVLREASPPGAYAGPVAAEDPAPTGAWVVKAPNGFISTLAPKVHQVVEHDDGTITVSPSILIERPPRGVWHGYLERGIWREV